MRWRVALAVADDQRRLRLRGRERQDRPSRCRRIRSAPRCGKPQRQDSPPLFPAKARSSAFHSSVNCPGRAVRLLLMVDDEGRRPDRAGERPCRACGAARPAPARHDQADGRRGRFGNGRLAQQEHRPAGLSARAVQPPRRGQVEPCGIAARSRGCTADERRRCRAASSAIHSASSSLGASREQQCSRARCRTAHRSPAHREAGFAEDLGGADPQQRRASAALLP